MFLLSLTATCQMYSVSLKAGQSTYNQHGADTLKCMEAYSWLTRSASERRSRQASCIVSSGQSASAGYWFFASLRKQWALELEEKFNLPALILDPKAYRKAELSGTRPILQLRNSLCEELKTLTPDLAIIDKALK